MIGETILHYKILEKLGEGGMGEVFKAQDTKLDRFVALKFLPSKLTATEAEKARFIQEAKTASSMNHPNVCTIYSIEEYENKDGDKQLFIAMEFVDGKTLTDKKDTLSDKQKLEIGIQIAEGLAAAHEKGIVHRDIKPDNIMIRKDGIVQIMDFGLAKLYSSKDISRLTKAGTTLGTMGYMSPEQIQGQDVDHRTDIFSLGLVLYELFAGQSPFKGMHEAALVYEIVNIDVPPISEVKPEIDPELERLILECLGKDKDERFQSAKELARSLRKLKRGSTGNRTSRMYNVSGIKRAGVQQNTATNLSGPLVYDDVPLKKLLRNIVYNRKILWTSLSICFIAAVLFFYLFLVNKTSNNLSGLSSLAASIDPPSGYKFSFTSNGYEGVHLAVSPDGKMLAFVAQDSTGKNFLWVRQLDAITAQELNGTEGAYYPFWSYDSKYIGFFADGKLKKILASGGPSIAICNAADARGGSWNQNDIIVFEPEESTGIFKVPASGGKPMEVTKLDTAKGETTQRWPCFLPDGNHFIFYVRAGVSNSQAGDAIYVSSLDGKEEKKLFSAHSNAVYADKNILYVQDNTLMAQPFDPNSLKLTGSAVPIEENVLFSQRFNCAVFSVSRNGVLFYQRGNTTNGMQLAWYDRNGKKENVFGKPDDYRQAVLSPDETKIALSIYDDNSRSQNIWLYDIKRNIYTRFTFSSANDEYPCWSPDGKWIVFASNRKNSKFELYEKSANGIGDVIQLTNNDNNSLPLSWSSDNKYIGFAQQNTKTKYDVYILPVSNIPKSGYIKPEVLFNSKFNEGGPWFSPDNKWIAYVTDESGQLQLYVSPFPDFTRGKWQVSTVSLILQYIGWAADGRGLYYVGSNYKVMYVEVSPHGNEIDIGKTTPLFDIPFSSRAQFHGVKKDNKQFLFFVPTQNKETPPLTIVTNWYSKLKQKD